MRDQPSLTTATGRSWLILGGLLALIAVVVMVPLLSQKPAGVALFGICVIVALYATMVIVRLECACPGRGMLGRSRGLHDRDRAGRRGLCRHRRSDHRERRAVLGARIAVGPGTHGRCQADSSLRASILDRVHDSPIAASHTRFLVFRRRRLKRSCVAPTAVGCARPTRIPAGSPRIYCCAVGLGEGRLPVRARASTTLAEAVGGRGAALRGSGRRAAA